VLGFLTRTVADTALLVDVTAARAPERPLTEAARTAPGKLRIALSFKPQFPARVDQEVRSSIEGVAERLRALGHEVVESDPGYGRALDAWTVRFLAGVAQDVQRVARPERLQRRTRGFARMGGLIGSGLMKRARRDEARHAARLGELFRDHDVLLTPTCARPPVDAAEWEGMSALRTLLGMGTVYPFTGVWNMTGQPALSIPGPPAGTGLPIGAQLVGPPEGEDILVSLGAQLERELDWPSRRPPLV
jgi:amidase